MMFGAALPILTRGWREVWPTLDPSPEADAPAGRDEATSAGSLPKRLHLHNTNLVHANERLMAAGTRQQRRSCGDQ